MGKDGDSKPGLILIEYRDGFKFAMLLIPDVIVPDTDRDGQSGFDGAGGQKILTQNEPNRHEF